MWLHALVALGLAAVLLSVTVLFSARVYARPACHSVACAAVLLSSHISPLYLTDSHLFPLGVLLSLIVLALLLGTRAASSGRIALFDWAPATRGPRLLWGMIGVLVLIAFINQFGEMMKIVGNVTDFRMFYEAATALDAGGDPYSATEGGYFYPPTFAYYLRSITWLPLAGASLLWFTLKLSLLFWAYRAVFKMTRGRVLTGSVRHWFIIGILLVAARFVLSDLQYGNTNTFVLSLAIGAVWLDIENRRAMAGLALAGAISIKVVPSLFVLYLVCRGRWRTLVWTAAWIVALNLAPLPAASRNVGDAWTSYLETGVVGKLSDSLAQPDNQSLWGALNRLFGWPLSVMRLMWGALSLVLTAAAARVAYTLRHESPFAQARVASLFFLLGLLVSPGSWVVHYSAVLLPMTVLLRHAMDTRPVSLPLWIAFGLANLAFTLSGWFRPTVRLSIEQSWFVIGAVLLFAMLVRFPTRRRTRDPGTLERFVLW